MTSCALVVVLLATLCQGQDLTKPHVINGNEALPHSHPHQVALQTEEPIPTHFCGGSLLSENWAITAAHCVESRDDNFFVTAGAHNVELEEETQQRIKVSQVVVHPSWNRITAAGDIALIKLKNSARIDGKTVKPIRLPKLSDKEKSFYNYEATMTGWGRTKVSSNGRSPTLQVTTERIMSNLTCKAAFLFLYVYETNICMHGIRMKSGCQGDSGGPLIVTEEDGERTLVGLTSYGLVTCTVWPTVFTRVSSYVDWIHEKTGLPVRE